MKFVYLFVFVCLLAACKKEPIDGYSGTGKAPIYVPLAELLDVRNLPPQPIEQSGSIFLRDSLFFMLESGKGIHVFNIKDSLNTKKVTFIRIPAASDFSVYNNLIYAAAWRDLVVVDISDLLNVREAWRSTNAFEPFLYPPLYNGPFECVDERKGAVIGWETVFLKNTLCNTVN
jgi:hypothetical protein